MDKINVLFEEAVQRTKEKTLEDIEYFMEWQDSEPAFEEYLDKRGNFLKQIWNNIWTNKAQSAFSLKERKKYLIEKGINFDGSNKKLIKKLFADEMSKIGKFDVENWLHTEMNDERWKFHFDEAKRKAVVRLEQKVLQAKRNEAETMILEMVSEIKEKIFMNLYTYVRYRVGSQLGIDLRDKSKFKRIGRNWENERLVPDGTFSIHQYKQTKQFFDEYTGNIIEDFNWGRLYYDFETFGEVYYQHILSFIYDGIKSVFFDEFKEVYHTYEENTGTKLKQRQLMKLISDEMGELTEEYLDLICDEYVTDLLAIAEIPYDISKHRAILKEQQRLQEERRMQEELERKRKKEEEERMIGDVFGGSLTKKEDRAIQYVLHIGETNTGKTYQALERLKLAESGCYLAPLRLLALEVFDTLNNDGVPCNLKTGEEEKESPNAKHISCTVEMFYEKDEYECIVIDEAQMIADKERGFSWYKAITGANAKEVHIIGSKSSKNMLTELLEGSQVTIKEYTRDTPLEVESKPFSIDKTKQGDALICFSRRRVLETASFLQRRGKKVSMIYGSMPPETRQKQIERFNQGETSIIVSTDAIGMGLNLPIRRIVFLENEKFDGTKRRRLTSQEVKQIAGRAGRKGIYDVGRVAFTDNINQMKELLEQPDESLSTFTIAPTNSMFERFQKYSNHLGTFFDLWNKFKNPNGTIKATLSEERELYHLIQGTEIEARFSMMDLYGFLHLPFSSGEKSLTNQWLRTMEAIINNDELPEPIIKKGSLDEIELSYKAIGLYLLFLYRLGRKTEAIYWERLRKEISDEANDHLKSAINTYKKKCKRCGRKLPYDYPYGICDRCYNSRSYR